MDKTKMLVALLALGAAGLPCERVTAQTPSATMVSGQIVTHLQVHRGSADYERARGWVQKSAKRAGPRVGSASNLDADALGEVIYVDIVHHTGATGLSAMSGPSLPALPLDARVFGIFDRRYRHGQHNERRLDANLVARAGGGCRR